MDYFRFVGGSFGTALATNNMEYFKAMHFQNMTEIQNYEFTTLTPNLGVVKINEWDSFVMADIPGIIDGASEGKGLGIQFLKHIERTSMLLFMVDVSFYIDLDDQYIKLQKELKAYSDVLSKRPFAIAITKIDMANDEYNHNDFFKKSSIGINDYEYNQDRWILKEDFSNTQKENKPLFIMEISSINQKNIKNLKKELFFHIQNTK